LSALHSNDTKYIEGFEPHDQFMQRRLADTYDFIEGTATQYEHIQNLLRNAEQRLNAITSLQSLRQETRRLKLAEWQTHALIHIQQAAARAFWVVLFPYYSARIALGLLEDESSPRFLLGLPMLPLKYVIIAAFLLYGFWRGFGKKPVPMANRA